MSKPNKKKPKVNRVFIPETKEPLADPSIGYESHKLYSQPDSTAVELTKNIEAHLMSISALRRRVSMLKRELHEAERELTQSLLEHQAVVGKLNEITRVPIELP